MPTLVLRHCPYHNMNLPCPDCEREQKDLAILETLSVCYLYPPATCPSPDVCWTRSCQGNHPSTED
jgi:hypothetical protein